ncbi:MAG: hypothetical protein HFJ58_07200 [Clostridia bacterium]|nr:hypothetical protein [Clostridia bacterium]
MAMSTNFLYTTKRAKPNRKMSFAPAINIKRCSNGTDYSVKLDNQDYCIVEMPSGVIWDPVHIAELSVNEKLKERIMGIIRSFEDFQEKSQR